jgi:hypothetical protein
MALKLCTGDPLVDLLRSTFGANIVRIPEARVQPLSCVAVRGKDVAFRGNLGFLFPTGQPLDAPDFAMATSPMSNLSGRESRAIDVGLGMDILGGFLNGMPAANIQGAFAGAEEVAFSFGDVRRKWIDEGWLGHFLPSCLLNLQNAVVRDFTTKPTWGLLIITSVITSNEFTLRVTKANSEAFSLGAPLLHGVVKASASFGIKAVTERAVTFKGKEPLTFAFTTVRAHVDALTGKILSIPAEKKFITLAADDVTDTAFESYGLDHVVLGIEPSLMEWTSTA